MMKSYEETIRNVHSRIAMYETEKRRKRAQIAGTAAAVTPVCLAAVIGTGLWKSGSFKTADIQTSEVPVASVTDTVPTGTPPVQTSEAIATTEKTAAATQTAPDRRTEPEESAAETVPAGDAPAEASVSKADEPQRISCYDGTDAPATTAQTRTVTKPAVTETSPVQTEPAAGNGPCLRESDEPPVYRNLITAYPVSCSADYRAPYDGEVCYTMPLYYAMQEYGADADYMVIIEIYSGGTDRLFELADLRAEWERLGALGYEAGLNQPSNAAPFLTLHATYEELQNFPAETDRGFFLRLYTENEPSCIPGAYNE